MHTCMHTPSISSTAHWACSSQSWESPVLSASVWQCLSPGAAATLAPPSQESLRLLAESSDPLFPSLWPEKIAHKKQQLYIKYTMLSLESFFICNTLHALFLFTPPSFSSSSSSRILLESMQLISITSGVLAWAQMASEPRIRGKGDSMP